MIIPNTHVMTYYILSAIFFQSFISRSIFRNNIFSKFHYQVLVFFEFFLSPLTVLDKLHYHFFFVGTQGYADLATGLAQKSTTDAITDSTKTLHKLQHMFTQGPQAARRPNSEHNDSKVTTKFSSKSAKRRIQTELAPLGTHCSTGRPNAGLSAQSHFYAKNYF